MKLVKIKYLATRKRKFIIIWRMEWRFNIAFSASVLLISVVFIGVSCKSSIEASEAPRTFDTPPVNHFLSTGLAAVHHHNPAQQFSTKEIGPKDTTHTLSADEIIYTFTGASSSEAHPSSLYPDKRRVLWVSSANGIFKLDEKNYDILAHLPSESASINTKTHCAKYIQGLDNDNSDGNKALVLKAAQLDDPTYSLVDMDNFFYVVNQRGQLIKYGDVTENDFYADVEAKDTFQMPETMGKPVGINMSYDGWIIIPTYDGQIIALSRDFQVVTSISLSMDSIVLSQAVSIDKMGGVYAATDQAIHKVIWTGSEFSTNDTDGAWQVEYASNVGPGAQSAPILMGFDTEDKFVVSLVGSNPTHVILIDQNSPKDSTRTGIVAQLPIDLPLEHSSMGMYSCAVGQMGILVTNHTPRNVPAESNAKWYSGYLGSNPLYQSRGAQKFIWDVEKKELLSQWKNQSISVPNSAPVISIGSNLVYMIGARDNQWTLEALDWNDGHEVFHYTLGGQQYNSLFSNVVMTNRGKLMFGSSWGRVKLNPTLKLTIQEQ